MAEERLRGGGDLVRERARQMPQVKVSGAGDGEPTGVVLFALRCRVGRQVERGRLRAGWRRKEWSDAAAEQCCGCLGVLKIPLSLRWPRRSVGDVEPEEACGRTVDVAADRDEMRRGPDERCCALVSMRRRWSAEGYG